MKKRILIVDDDLSVRSSLEKILLESGYEVSAFENGESAEPVFSTGDLLILDLNLPIQDGWDILSHVNADCPLLPVIAITGLANELYEHTIPGASAFLEKPIEAPLLLRTIERLLNLSPEDRLQQSSCQSQFPCQEIWRSPLIRSVQSEQRSRRKKFDLI